MQVRLTYRSMKKVNKIYVTSKIKIKSKMERNETANVNGSEQSGYGNDPMDDATVTDIRIDAKVEKCCGDGNEISDIVTNVVEDNDVCKCVGQDKLDSVVYLEVVSQLQKIGDELMDKYNIPQCDIEVERYRGVTLVNMDSILRYIMGAVTLVYNYMQHVP